MVGKTISHYRIVSQLGSGGMGVVYAAEDPRLNRQVALKFVPEDLVNDAHALERLRSEARTASGLNHPNICTIYDIGEHEGRPFIVMELLKGQTLRERMSAKPLKIHEAVDIGIQAADALVWAHSKDIIHRDIKPANLFLVDQGALKILDFGLAKYVTAPGSEATLAPTVDLTAVGVALGTVAYMSPEQASGEPLDRRTDLFSLGVVLYECVTGQQPFQGKTSAVVLAAILTQQPKPPMALNATIPPGLQDVIQNCLEKDRELRFQDAAGLRADLKRVRRDLESGALRVAPTVTGAVAAVPAPSSGSARVPVVGSSNAAPADGGPRDLGRPRDETAGTAAGRPASRRSLAIGAGVAALALVGVGIALTLSRRPLPAEPVHTSEPGPSADATPQVTQPAAAAAAVAPAAPAVPAPAADDAGRASKATFDAAIVDANRLLASGDAQGATRALNIARGIDPASGAVTELSSRLVEHFRAESARRTAANPPRSQTAPKPAEEQSAQVTARAAQAPPPAPTAPAPAAAPAAPAAASTAGAPSAAPATEAAPPPAATKPSEPVAPPPRPEPERRSAPAPPPAAATPATPAVDDDDAAIRHVVATYARAIETKDIALYRSVKPNLSGAEQRTIEDGFRAVTSQRVQVTIQSIEHRGPDARVWLRRHDVIQAGGRQQTADSQQTLTLTRTPGGWVIREIGR
jgi:tRNA A-37 threonylcarbamoyl transferase component Bud32